jgi:hypothetical protein
MGRQSMGGAVADPPSVTGLVRAELDLGVLEFLWFLELGSWCFRGSLTHF